MKFVDHGRAYRKTGGGLPAILSCAVPNAPPGAPDAKYDNGGPQCQPVRVKDLDGFEWEEEQRAVRALWRYELIYELKRAILVNKSMTWAIEMTSGLTTLHTVLNTKN